MFGRTRSKDEKARAPDPDEARLIRLRDAIVDARAALVSVDLADDARQCADGVKPRLFCNPSFRPSQARAETAAPAAPADMLRIALTAVEFTVMLNGATSTSSSKAPLYADELQAERYARTFRRSNSATAETEHNRTHGAEGAVDGSAEVGAGGDLGIAKAVARMAARGKAELSTASRRRSGATTDELFEEIGAQDLPGDMRLKASGYAVEQSGAGSVHYVRLTAPPGQTLSRAAFNEQAPILELDIPVPEDPVDVSVRWASIGEVKIEGARGAWAALQDDPGKGRGKLAERLMAQIADVLEDEGAQEPEVHVVQPATEVKP
ncbi:MAG: hypothetical protein ACFB2Z_14915 [Maricaulaceae bacterium]